MLKKQLAEALGISPAMVTKLGKRGMPVDSVERAEKWRRRHLEPSRVKGNRMDASFGRTAPSQVGASTPSQTEDMGTVAEALLLSVANMLDAGQDIRLLVPALRSALAAVPEVRRATLQLPVSVMNVLTEGVAASLVPATSIMKAVASRMTDQEAETMGRFWYSVAAGEIVAT